MFNSGIKSNQILKVVDVGKKGVDFLFPANRTEPAYTTYERFGTDMGNPTVYGINGDSQNVRPRSDFADCISLFPRLNDFNQFVTVIEFNQAKFACYVNYYMDLNARSPFSDEFKRYLISKFEHEILSPLMINFYNWEAIRRTTDIQNLDLVLGTNYFVAGPQLGSIPRGPNGGTGGGGDPPNPPAPPGPADPFIHLEPYIINRAINTNRDLEGLQERISTLRANRERSTSEVNRELSDLDRELAGLLERVDNLSDPEKEVLIIFDSEQPEILEDEKFDMEFDWSEVGFDLDEAFASFGLEPLPIEHPVVLSNEDSAMGADDQFEGAMEVLTIGADDSVVVEYTLQEIIEMNKSNFAFYGGTREFKHEVILTRFGPIKLVRDLVSFPLIDVRFLRKVFPSSVYIDPVEMAPVTTLSGELQILGSVNLGLKSRIYVTEFSDESYKLLSDYILVPMDWDSHKPWVVEVEGGVEFFSFLESEGVWGSHAQTISKLLVLLLADDELDFWKNSHYHEYFRLLDSLTRIPLQTLFNLVNKFSSGSLIPCYFFAHIKITEGRNHAEEEAIKVAAYNVYSMLGLERGLIAGILSGLIPEHEVSGYLEKNQFYVEDEVFSDATIARFMNSLSSNLSRAKNVSEQAKEAIQNFVVRQRHFYEFEGKTPLRGDYFDGFEYENLNLLAVISHNYGNGQVFSSPVMNVRAKGNFSWYTKYLGYPRFPDPERSTGFFAKISDSTRISPMLLFEALSLQTYLVLKAVSYKSNLRISIDNEIEEEKRALLMAELKNVKFSDENYRKRDLVFGFSRALIKYLE